MEVRKVTGTTRFGPVLPATTESTEANRRYYRSDRRSYELLSKWAWISDLRITPLPKMMVMTLLPSLELVTPPICRLAHQTLEKGWERRNMGEAVKTQVFTNNTKHTGQRIYPEVRTLHKEEPTSTLLRWPLRSDSLSPPCLSQGNHKGLLSFFTRIIG